MRNFLTLIALIVLASCSEDCSECEKKLAYYYSLRESIPVDLPQPESEIIESNKSVLTIGVNAQNLYIFKEEIYPYDELVPLIDQEMSEIESNDRKLKINGDRMADYEAVFRLIAFCKEANISPILVFSDN